MRLKFEDWCDESEYTWEVVHDDTHFEPHLRNGLGIQYIFQQ